MLSTTARPTDQVLTCTNRRQQQLQQQQQQTQQQQLQTTSFQFNPNTPTKFRRRDSLPGQGLTTMNGAEPKSEPGSMSAVSAPPQVVGMWTTPTSQGMRPRPATIHEGFSYCMGEEYGALPSWDSSGLSLQQTPSDTISRPISVHGDYYSAPPMENSEWRMWMPDCRATCD